MGRYGEMWHEALEQAHRRYFYYLTVNLSLALALTLTLTLAGLPPLLLL